MEDGRLDDVATRDEIASAAHSPEEVPHERNLTKADPPTVSPGADLFSAGYRALRESGLRVLPVSGDGELVGMLTIEYVAQANLARGFTQGRGNPAE